MASWRTGTAKDKHIDVEKLSEKLAGPDGGTGHLKERREEEGRYYLLLSVPIKL